MLLEEDPAEPVGRSDAVLPVLYGDVELGVVGVLVEDVLLEGMLLGGVLLEDDPEVPTGSVLDVVPLPTGKGGCDPGCPGCPG